MPPVISPARLSPFEATSPVSLSDPLPKHAPPSARPETSRFENIYELEDAGPDQVDRVHPISPTQLTAGLGDGRDWPLFTAGLAPEAAEFIRLLRLWSVDMGRPHFRSPFHALRRALGEDDAQCAYLDFRRIVGILAEGRRRRFRTHAPMCPCLTADEAALAAFCLACSPAGVHAHARAIWLVRGEQSTTLVEAMTQFYRVLRRLAANA